MPNLGRARRMRGILRILALLLALPACAAALEGRVIHVADGDTLTVLDARHESHKIRLAGIDAPERGQPFGRRSAEALTRLTTNRIVRVDGGKVDRYQRRVGVVRVAPADCASCTPSLDVGLALIGAGLAWHYLAYAREQSPPDRLQYQAAEAGARSRQDGLWADAAPTPPWDWRRARRDGNAAARH